MMRYLVSCLLRLVSVACTMQYLLRPDIASCGGAQCRHPKGAGGPAQAPVPSFQLACVDYACMEHRLAMARLWYVP